jgi:hypothetical protein
MNKSWRTSTLGVVAILTAVLGCIKAILDNDLGWRDAASLHGYTVVAYDWQLDP